MRLDLDDGYYVNGDGVSVDLHRATTNGDGKVHDKLVGYYGGFEGALRAYVDITARRDGGAAEILRVLLETKAAAGEVGKMMDDERKATAKAVAV
jgi:hypothetical protein